MMTAIWGRARSLLSSVPAFLGALVPVFKSCPPCPVCMPKYAAILSLLGLELADYTHYLLPVMFISMGATLFFMHRQIRQKHLSYIPLLLASLSCLGLLFVKYVLDHELVVYGFMASLFGAIVWHQANMRKAKKCCEVHHH